MASRKAIWDSMDKMEGKKVGSSHAALNKERVRQGYKAEARTKALKKEGKHMPDGGWVGKKAEGSHSKFHYGK